MAIRNQSIITAPSGILLGAQSASLAMWFQINGSTVINQDAILFGNQYVDTIAAVIVAGTNNKLRTMAVVSGDGNYCDVNILPDYAYNFIAMFTNSDLEVFLNNVAVGKVTSDLKGTLGKAGATGKPFQIGDKGIDATIGGVALWKNYILTADQRLGLRNKSIDPKMIAPGNLIWYMPLNAGGAGIVSVAGGIAVPNQKLTYVDDLNYVPPATIKLAKVGMSGQILSLLCSDLKGNLVNCLSCSVPNAILSNSPRIEIPVPIGTNRFTQASGWAMTDVGEMGSVDIPLGIPDSLLPAFQNIKKSMRLGTNVAMGGISVPVCPFANRAKIMGPFFSRMNLNDFVVKDNGYISSMGTNKDLSAFLVDPLEIQETTDLYTIAPESDFLNVEWKGTNKVSIGNLDVATTINLLHSRINGSGKNDNLYGILAPSKQASPALQIGVDGSDVNDLDIRFGYNSEEGEFDREFLKMGEGYCSTRFMDALGTNNCNVVDWEDMPDEDQLSYVSGKTRTINLIAAEHWTANNYFLARLGLPILFTTQGNHGLKEGQQVIFNGTIALQTANPTDTLTLTGYMPIVHIVSGNQFAITRGPDKGGSGITGQTIVVAAVNGSVSVTTKTGWPIGVIVRYCNKQRSDCYLNVGHAMSDDCFRKMIRVVARGLLPGLKVRVAYTNERWNPDFLQTQYCDCMGALIGGSGSDWYVKRAGQLFAIAVEEMGKVGRAGDLRRVLETQGAFFAGTGKSIIDAAIKQGVAFDEWALALYFWFGPLSMIDGASLPSLTDEQFMDIGEMSIQYQGIREIIAGNRAILDNAELSSVQMITYEGGPGFLGFNDAARSRRLAENERMEGVLDYYLDILEQGGITIYHDYMLFGVYGDEYLPGGSVWPKNTKYNGGGIMARTLKQWIDRSGKAAGL